MFVTKFKNICLKIHCTCALDLALKSFIKFKTGVLKFPGFAFIVDNKNKLKGVITDGDIRRAYAKNINISSSKVADIMTKDPIVINEKVKQNQILLQCPIQNSQFHTIHNSTQFTQFTIPTFRFTISEPEHAEMSSN